MMETLYKVTIPVHFSGGTDVVTFIKQSRDIPEESLKQRAVEVFRQENDAQSTPVVNENEIEFKRVDNQIEVFNEPEIAINNKPVNPNTVTHLHRI